MRNASSRRSNRRSSVSGLFSTCRGSGERAPPIDAGALGSARGNTISRPCNVPTSARNADEETIICRIHAGTLERVGKRSPV